MIDSFRNEYSWLSNFYMRPVVIAKIVFPTNEHFFAANKTLNPEQFTWVVDSLSPSIAKRRGKLVSLRSDWNEVKVSIMGVGLYHKFTQHQDLKQKLVDTGEEMIVEGNYWHDNFWGNCMCGRLGCEGIQGENVLGRLHMELRKLFLSWAKAGYTSKAGNLTD